MRMTSMSALLGVSLALYPAVATAQGAPLLTLADTTLFPEGIVRDDARSRWLLSSVRQRTVVAGPTCSSNRTAGSLTSISTVTGRVGGIASSS